MKIMSPKIGKQLVEKKITKEDCQEDWNDWLIENQVIDFSVQGLEFNGCKFINVDFSKCSMKDVDLLDCIFEKCDLAGKDFSNRSIHRCQFQNCNLVGCDFIQSSIQDVLIIHSKGDYVNFSDSNIRRLEIRSSTLRDGRFVSIQFKDVIFDGIDFQKTEFLNTQLKGIDFSSCNIQDIALTPNDIRGAILSYEQVILLSSLFGIIIKE